MINKFILIAIVALLVGCGDPKEKVIPTDVAKWETDLVPTLNKLDPKDKELVVAYLARSKLSEAFGGKSLASGMTVGQALSEQKEWQDEQARKQAEEKALKEKIEAERQALQQRIDDAVTVTLLKLALVKESYQTNQVIELGFQNKTQKDIAGIKGSMHFIDIFDKDVGAISFSFDDGVKAGAISTWKGSRHYNEFLEAHRAIAGLVEGKFKAKFEPEMIVFVDGEKLKIDTN